MQKNTKTYLLLILVAIIWGIVIYQIIGAVASEPQEATNSVAVKMEQIPVHQKDTFSIAANHRDPFLGTPAKKEVKKKKTVVKPKKAPAPEISIQYTGLVTDKDTKRKIFFVTIEGQQHLMGINDEVEKVRLLSGSSTSIRIRYNGKTRTIELQK